MSTETNTRVFKEIYDSYAKDIRRFLFYKTQDVQKAEDLAQDVFLKLWDNLNRIDIKKVKSYLFTIANNLFLNDIKHQNVKDKYKQTVKQHFNNESPEFIILEKEFMQKLDTTIKSLPDKQREVFLLSRIEKKTYKEIAIQLNLSVKAIEKRMHQALVTMRKDIGNV